MDKNQEKFDDVMEAIADYVCQKESPSEEAMQTASLSLADSLGCALLALQYPACKKLLGPVVPGTIVPNGCHVPGVNDPLDPICGAFNLGTMIRWLDYNDTWLAAEWGHPSDNIGAILPLMDFLSRQNLSRGKLPFNGKDLLLAIIKAYEIQGILSLSNSFNRIGFDHVIFVKVATAAVATALLGGTRQQILNALSHAWIDTGPLRTYRHAPNTGPRKSWAAGDAASRGVQLAMLMMRGEEGYPTALTASKWGLYDVLFGGKAFSLMRPFGSYVIENILFKVSFPAEFHAQTAVEGAIQLHALIKKQIGEDFEKIKRIEIQTHESALRIIDKKGPLKGPADRDHCLQYMVAIGLLHGHLNADHYEEDAANDHRIDLLREKMYVSENTQYSRDYLDPDKRSIANAITVHFTDDVPPLRIAIEYPLGHKRRRKEAMPLLFQKLERNLQTQLQAEKIREIIDLFQDQNRLEELAVPSLVDHFYRGKKK